MTECLWFFQPIQAKCSGFEPYFSMWSRPALPNICGANGDSSGSRTSNMRIMCLSSAVVRSVYFIPSEPCSIFSKPTASAQSTRPPWTAWRARNSAEEPVEQLLLTLTTGMPVRPSS